MGEVYKAKDTRLDRTVAIKIVTPDLASDPHFRERFDREARTISQLDHPHICALYDVGEQDGTSFLVMQYLDGETLETRLQQGPLPVNQALALAIQISEALDTAHRAGIVHRDLKPGNVMLTKSGPKLLDFGLAKPNVAGIAATAGSISSTKSAHLTAEGMILGTLQYMAPEQLQGRDADARTDLFAFGCVVYEMLTGQKAFAGQTQASLIAAILEHEPPPIGTSQPLTPPALDHVVRRCLAKDPEERWQTAGDVMRELKWIAESGSPASVLAQTAVQRGIRVGLSWVLTAVSLLVATVLAVVLVNLRSQKQEPFRFLITPPGNPNTELRWNIAISPDGRRLAFVAPASGAPTGPSTPVLWVQPLDGVVAQPLPGTEGADQPFWSPDSRFLGFFADAKLKKIDASGGPLQVLCDGGAGYGGTWNGEGVILFAPRLGDGIYRVSDAGGNPDKVTTLDASRHEALHGFPSFLPDGRHFLFSAGSLAVDGRGLRIGSLDSNETKPVLNMNSNALYAPPGYLLFVRDANLMAQPFDAKSGTLSGKAVPVAQHVGWYAAYGLGFFSVSQVGVLVYRNGSLPDTRLQWFDRNGTKLGALGEPASFYSNPALSQDGTKLAVDRLDLHTGTRDIWLFDLRRGTPSRVTDTPGSHFNPVWSADGQRILFTSDRKGHRDIYQKAASGVGGEEDVVIESGSAKNIEDMSVDGRYLVYNTGGTGTPSGLWALPLFGNAKPFHLPQPANSSVRGAQFSHDGRWIAYTSDESGKDEVYVETFPERRDKLQISTGGGNDPMWRRDGKELFYIAGNNIMAVEAKASGDQLQPGIPRVVLETLGIAGLGPAGKTQRNRYVVTADGQRFLIVSFAEQGPVPITVVTNWIADLKK